MMLLPLLARHAAGLRRDIRAIHFLPLMLMFCHGVTPFRCRNTLPRRRYLLPFADMFHHAYFADFRFIYAA